LAYCRGDLLEDAGRRVESVELEIRPQQLDDRPVGGRALVRLGAPLEDAPRLRLRRSKELVYETRLADAGLGADGGDLATASARELEQSVQPLELGDTADER